MIRLSAQKFWTELNSPEDLVGISREIHDYLLTLDGAEKPTFDQLMRGKMVTNLFIVIDGTRADLLIDMNGNEAVKVSHSINCPI